MEYTLEQQQRAAVVSEALSWVGTPYHHEADVKGPRGSVDCGMLIVRCFVDTGVVPRFDPRPYPQYWYLHRDTERYLSFVLDRATPRAEGEEPQPGDVLVWKHGRCFSHGAIVTQWPRFVHAYAPFGVCVQDNINTTPMKERAMKVFNPWGGR
jgi:cell wall-associated NlpC family hydrolase